MNTPQEPICSGFSRASTTVDVIKGINLVGKVAIVTGGYSGLGLETARTLALAGARVIVPARNVERARKAITDAGGGIEVWSMDLTNPDSVDDFARDFVETGLPLHILINNAGIMALPELKRDAQGNELQFSTNHLGHFRLALRLWPALKRAGSARVVSISSAGHRFSPVVFDDINFVSRDYDAFKAYGQSKTANILFAVGLDKRGKEHNIRAFALHPGGIAGTNLGMHVGVEMLKKTGFVDEKGRPVIDLARDLKSIPQGAATHVWCAVSPQLDGKGGVFCADSDITSVLPDSESPDLATENRANRDSGVQAYAIEPNTADELWRISEEISGVSIPY
ncbi:NAD(P)-dependent dehydrogenase (short-subunit alcohol dehydrogenase family) [Vibrio diazotrophicus]|uniref:NAD(P)-dependent dehydrogenase (Short-subunit alcohol dehydrogenase family) n=1 Tax=Vibrio diazotrophicus TaxID=685 RepID=A0A329E4U4_VIBDI|nr:SDR family NAD(P)-dependent oxidoreductase [Vibrio diazotrophicus]RAS59126.1 NAD(P)-dependent dehydrogenase (short-subunit alcohol dehydrogenase family) [Vibrio diazotrophicus]